MSLCLTPQPILNQAGMPQGPSDQKVVVVTVDNCDTSVALRFGHVIGNYTCSAQGSQSGSKKYVHWGYISGIEFFHLNVEDKCYSSNRKYINSLLLFTLHIITPVLTPVIHFSLQLAH